MKLIARPDGDAPDEWHVWLVFDDLPGNQPPDGLSWIVGVGTTRKAAIEDARLELARALGELRLLEDEGDRYGEEEGARHAAAHEEEAGAEEAAGDVDRARPA